MTAFLFKLCLYSIKGAKTCISMNFGRFQERTGVHFNMNGRARLAVQMVVQLFVTGVHFIKNGRLLLHERECKVSNLNDHSSGK